MRLPNSGDLTEHGVAEIFQSVAEAKASGLLYIKNAAGVNAFVVFARGVAVHASGEIGEGEEAIQKALAWAEGDYRFLEDVKPDPGKFPPNIAAAAATSLAGARLPSPDPSRAVLPPMPVLPCRGPAVETFGGGLGELLSEQKGRGFSGTAAVTKGGTRIGLLVFKGGDLSGSLMWDGTRYVRGERALTTFEAVYEAAASSCQLSALPPEAVTALAAGLSGRIAIARVPTPVINVDEFIAWAQQAGFSGLMSVLTAQQAANVLFYEGQLLGSAHTDDLTVKKNCDEALALYYSPGTTVEVYRALPGT